MKQDNRVISLSNQKVKNIKPKVVINNDIKTNKRFKIVFFIYKN